MFNDLSSYEMPGGTRSRRSEGAGSTRTYPSGQPAAQSKISPTESLKAQLGRHPNPLGRTFDVSIASLLLIGMLPALVVIALAIWLGDGGNPFFSHRRVGRGGRFFPCFKFRTMVRDSDARLRYLLDNDQDAAREWEHYRKLRRDPRVTPLGRFLRKTSLDEIPQLANVLVGHMSLVGPRPIVEDEIVRYRRYFAHYCMMRPGITGLWQVSGRNDVSYRRRVALDLVYCRSKSVPLDLMILARTVPAVLSGRGCS